jgi:hypothetical protein
MSWACTPTGSSLRARAAAASACLACSYHLQTAQLHVRYIELCTRVATSRTPLTWIKASLHQKCILLQALR